MKKQLCLPLFVSAGLICGSSHPLAAQDAKAPGTPGSFILFDAGVPTAINAQGTVVGYEDDKPYGDPAFYRLKDGTTVTFSAPDADYSTEALGINAGGTIVGQYFSAGSTYGFIRDPQGNITEFLVPGASDTEAYAINASGSIAGIWDDEDGYVYGFLRDPQGNYTELVLPNAEGFLFAPPISINAGGTVAGTYEDQNDIAQGYFREPGGPVRLLQIPNAYRIFVNGIDDAGRIYGYYTDGNGLNYGFRRDQFGNYTTINSSTDKFFFPVASDHADTLVGTYTPAPYAETGGQGFYRLGDGKIGFFNPPGSVGTIPSAVDPQGDITGIFYVNDSTYRAFIRLGNDSPLSCAASADPNAAP